MKNNNLLQESANPENWFLGIFYYNKNDHRLFPPKRFKYFGWTVNFANPYSIFAFIVLLFAVLAIIYLCENKINFN